MHGSNVNIFHEYLRENKKVQETVFACSYWARLEYFKQKQGQKSHDTVPLSYLYKLVPWYCTESHTLNICMYPGNILGMDCFDPEP